MKTEQALKIIKRYQAWRRSDEEDGIALIEPEKISEAIDVAIKALEEREATIKWAGVKA